MANARQSAASTLLTSEKFLMTGGRLDSAPNVWDTVEVLQRGKSSFEMSSITLPEAMAFHTVVRINDTSVFFVCAVLNDNPYYSARSYILDTETETFDQLPDMTIDRVRCMAGRLILFTTVLTGFNE